MLHSKKHLKRNSQRRRGVTTVETALVSTLLFAVIFAGMELSRVNVIRNTIENAAYEGARTGMIAGATNAECVASAQTYLDIIGVGTSGINVTPAVLDDSVKNVTVTVDVTMDGSNGYVFPTFFLGKTLRSTITLAREVH